MISSRAKPTIRARLAGGAHARQDFPKRNDEDWMKHTLCWADIAEKSVRLDYRPVHTYTLTNDVGYIQPKDRVY